MEYLKGGDHGRLRFERVSVISTRRCMGDGAPTYVSSARAIFCSNVFSSPIFKRAVSSFFRSFHVQCMYNATQSALSLIPLCRWMQGFEPRAVV